MHEPITHVVHHVNVLQRARVWRRKHIPQAHDVLMAQASQQLNLSQRATCVQRAVKHVADLLYCHPLVGGEVIGGAHQAVSTLADGADEGVAVEAFKENT